MITGISFVAVALLVIAFGLFWQLTVVQKKLAHYSDISDVEGYRTDCQKEAEAAAAEVEAFKQESASLAASLDATKKQVVQYRKVVKDFKSAADLQQYVQQMSSYAAGLKNLGELEAKIEHQTNLANQVRDDAAIIGFALSAAKDAGNIQSQIAAKRTELDELKKNVLAIEEVRDLQQYGFYQLKYDLGSSDHYKRKLDETRAQLKAMIKAKTAATCETEWTVEGSKSKGRKMVNDQIKLLLRAFNGESDAAVAKVSHSNATSMEGRIRRSYDQINRMGVVNQVSISRDYFDSKLRELYLAHEYQLQKEEEKLEQRRIKEEMREEAKVEREIEKAKQDADREEATKRQALERARAEIAQEEGRQTEKMAGLIAKLENELQEAIDRKAKAIARAELTKSGHVYVLSNTGAFGQGVYKIGMTRRLEPLERVKELGSASVPFLFDVHAMIYSDNAPELEATLHRHFNQRRVNLVNMRKEFFRVSLDEIQEAVAKHFGVVTFTLDHEADEYRQSVAKLAEETCEESRQGDQLVAG